MVRTDGSKNRRTETGTDAGTNAGKIGSRATAVGAGTSNDEQKTSGSDRGFNGGTIRTRAKRNWRAERLRREANARAESGGTPGGNSESGRTESDAAETKIDAEGFTLVQAQNLTGSDKPKRQYTKRKTARVIASDDSMLSAAVLIGILDGAAQSLVSPDAALSLDERTRIEEPLARILERLNPAINEKIATFSDPIYLIVALGMWSLRVYKIAETKNAQGKNELPVAPPEGATENIPMQTARPKREPESPEQMRSNVSPPTPPGLTELTTPV